MKNTYRALQAHMSRRNVTRMYLLCTGLCSAVATVHAQEFQYAIIENPAYSQDSYEPRASLPPLDSSLVNPTNYRGVFYGHPTVTTLYAFFDYEMRDLPPYYVSIDNFNHRLLRHMSVAQLGLPACTLNLNTIASAYFSANPTARWAVVWYVTNSFGECPPASGVSGNLTTTQPLPTTLVPVTACGSPINVSLTISGTSIGSGAIGIAFEGDVVGYQVCVAAHNMGTWGHTFITIHNAQATPDIESAGKYPNAETLVDMFSAPGMILDTDAAHYPCVSKACFRITAEQYEQLLEYVVEAELRPTRYTVLGDNCTTFAMRALDLIGINPGFTGRNQAFVHDPDAVVASLAAAGPRIGDCGRVEVCSPFFPSTPRNVSPSRLLDSLISDPVAVANDFALPFIQNPPLETPVVTSGTLILNSVRADNENQLLAVDWGDGSDSVLTDGMAQHTYSQHGEYQIRVRVMDRGAVHVYTMSATITNQAPNTVVHDITPPALPPTGMTNPLAAARRFPVNGTAEQEYNAPLSTQNTQTNFTNNNLGSQVFSSGSELDAVYGLVCNDMLYLTVAGNLKSDYTHLDLFIDSIPGGQNQITGPNPTGNFNALQAFNGMRFDSTFAADYFVTLNGGANPYRFFVDYSRLRVGTDPGISIYAGETTAMSSGILNGGQPNTLGISATINNSNIAGVTAGTGLSNGAGVSTGVELAIPLSAIGNPSGPIKVAAMLTNPGRTVISNQFLGGVSGAFVPASPTVLNMANLPGQQHVVIQPSLSLISGPQNAISCRGGQALFSVNASDNLPLTFLWRKNGVPMSPIANPTSSTPNLLISNVSTDDVAMYDCIVYSLCGSLISGPASLTLCAADFNCDGGIDGSDIESFFLDWEAGNSAADINEDGGIDGSDVELFFLRWEGGC